MSGRIENQKLDDGIRSSVPGDYVSLSHGYTRYQALGDADAPPVILVPGATLPYMVWTPLMQPLADAGYRVVCFDLYGRGYSDRPKVAYTQELFAQQIFELCDFLSISKPLNLVGLAFGAVICVDLVNDHPERISSMTLVAPDGLGVNMTFAQRLAYVKGIGEVMFRWKGDQILLSRLSGYSSDDSFVQEIRRNFEPTFRLEGFRRGLLSSIRNISVHHAETSYERAGRSDIPMQILWGENDGITPFESAPLMKRLLPNARFHSMAGVGHLPQYDRPDETSGIIKNFLESVSTGESPN
jgi:pimeloyl-ACP methyl ester carboxylesterase